MNILIKFSIIAAYLIYSNLEAKLFYRLDLLHHNFNGYSGIFVFSIIWAAAIYSIFLISTIKPTLIRIFVSAIFIGTTIPAFSYQLISGTEINYDNYSIMIDAALFASSAASFYLYDILECILVSAFGLAGFIYLPRDFDNNSFFSFIRLNRFLRIPIIVVPFILLFVLSALRGGYGLDGLPVQYKSLSLFSHIGLSKLIGNQTSRETVKLTPDTKTSPRHIVLIVEESVRGDFIDLNFDRGVTPSLINNQSKIINYGLASSATNCSAGSNFVFRTGANQTNFNQTLTQNPYIWEYAKKAGYKTIYLEAQATEGRLNNLMSLPEKEHIDEYLYSKGDSNFERDLDSITMLSEMLSKSEPSFIYIVKSGVHFPYEASYPSNKAIYNPHMRGGHFVKNQEEIVNSYKNAISWTINGYFEKFFEQINIDDNVIIYTSDHGQNHLENGSQLTHCSTDNVSRNEALVPLFIITENELYSDMFNKNRLKLLNKTSHFNIVPTVLQLFGYRKEDINLVHGHSLVESEVSIRKFLSGVVSEYRFTIGEKHIPTWNLFDEARAISTE